MMLVGGAAYYGFIVFEKLISNADISELNSPNRKLLFLAITILLITGITKLIIIFYEYNNFFYMNIYVLIKLYSI